VDQNYLINGPDNSPITILFAHGAGAAYDSSFMEYFSIELAKLDWRIVRFEFPYMNKRRLTGRQSPPDRFEILARCWSDHVDFFSQNSSVVVAGKSMGGRIASMLVDDWLVTRQVCGCICLGYPFHPLGHPEKLRIDHLIELRTPTLLIQGERDPMGRRDLVEPLPLSQNIQMQWAHDGDHSLKPRKASGRTEEDNRLDAIEAVDRYLKALVGS